MRRGDTWSPALVNYHSAGGSLGKSLVLTAGGGRKEKGHFHNKTIRLQAWRRTEDIKLMMSADWRRSGVEWGGGSE